MIFLKPKLYIARKHLQSSLLDTILFNDKKKLQDLGDDEDLHESLTSITNAVITIRYYFFEEKASTHYLITVFVILKCF